MNGTIHSWKVVQVVYQISILGEVLREKFIIAVLLNNLPEFFNIFIMALETMTEDELILNLVRGKLIDEVLRRKNSRSDISEDDNVLNLSHKQLFGTK